MAMEKILISACLLGHKVRFDGQGKKSNHALLDKWQAEGRLVPTCPEMAGGLPVPRPAAEIDSGDGDSVLAGNARVMTEEGADVTSAFVAGAQAALSLAREHNIRVAILKENSPSCASHTIYDGHFSGEKHSGQGVTAALLRSRGITVFSENELEEAEQLILT